MRTVTTLFAAPYYGGKSPTGTSMLGPWIASLLPRRKYYAEPFAGMAGVLLCRPACDVEVLNDLDGRIVAWWMAVRDAPDEFARRIDATPRARQVFESSCELIDDVGAVHTTVPDLDLAVAVHVVLRDGFTNALGAKHRGFGTLGKRRGRPDIAALAERLRHVTLESVDAAKIVERVGRHHDSVLYVDPPYPSAITSAYGVEKFDKAALAGAMRAAQGFVAVSGYGDEWDELGWHRTERRAVAHVGARDGGSPRTEVLWTNDEPANYQLGLDLGH